MDHIRIILIVSIMITIIATNSCFSLTNQTNVTIAPRVNRTTTALNTISTNATTSKPVLSLNTTKVIGQQNLTSTATPVDNAVNQTGDRPSNASTTTQQTIMIPSIDDHKSYECTCDLTSQSCDVNCCCDSDCSDFNREAFVDCVDVSKSRPDAYDPRYCFKNNFIVHNNSHYKFVQASDDLLCIYTDNFKQRFEYKEPQVVTGASHFADLEKKHSRHSWPATSKARLSLDNIIRETYKAGSPLYVKYTNGQIGYMALPRGIPMGACNGNNPMSFLTSQTFTCHQALTNLRRDCTSNVWLTGSTYFKNFEVARTPASFKDITNSTEEGGFFDVTPLLCILQDGFSGPSSCTGKSDIPETKYNETDGKCYNAVSSVVYVIEHNGTEGLLNVQAQLTLRDVSTSLDAISWSQTFSVTFEWTSSSTSSNENETSATNDQPVFVRSGNPGYRMGSPVIAGKLITRGLIDDQEDDDDDVLVVDAKKTESKVNKKAVDVSVDPSKWLTLIGPSESGFCLASTEERLSVRFGHHMKTGCQLLVSMGNVTGDWCQFIQSATIDALDGWPHSPEMVAAYGNPNVEILGEWVPILRENRPRVVGVQRHPTSTDSSCPSIVRELNIHVVYANAGHFANPQPKIIGVLYRYGLPAKLQLFGEDGNDDEIVESLQLTTSVTFVDASVPAVAIHAEPPAIDIHLPYDFFYPFHESSSAALYPQCRPPFIHHLGLALCAIIIINNFVLKL